MNRVKNQNLLVLINSIKKDLSKTNRNIDEQFELAWNNKMAQLEMEYEETL